MSDQTQTKSVHKDSPDTSWERDTLNNLLLETLAEQRRKRRWGVFFKLLTFTYFAVLLAALIWGGDLDVSQVSSGNHTALVEVEGVIAAEAKANADNVVTGLRKAFEDENTKGVILRMNTPGGSPVQSRYINREITRLKEKHPDIPVYAVVVDVCASGGYYIAAAADHIYADEGSLVGSIGVLMNGFGFVDAMQSLGVERRLLTAGENKAILDPFSPIKDKDVAHVKRMLDQLHQQFINTVKEGRGERLLSEQYPEVFSGLFWSGEEAKTLGLIDGFGSSSYVARELIGAEDIVDFTQKEDAWERFAERLGAGAAMMMARITGFNGQYGLQ